MKILVADRNLAPHHDLFEQSLPPGCDVTWVDSIDDSLAGEALADVAVVVSSTLPADVITGLPALRLVHSAGAGVDGIAHRALPPGVTVTNTYHHEDSIAEYILASLVLLRRRFLVQDRALRDGEWSSPVYDATLVQPRTLGDASVTFLGFGHIGSAAWRLLRHLGAEGIAITGSGRVDAARHGLRWAGSSSRLPDALAESDVLVVSIPLTPMTEGLVSVEELHTLGADGLLVNVARGPVVDQSALFKALQTRAIAGAALDVWYQYPHEGASAEPAREPFHRLDNVLMTPHSSGITSDTFRRRAVEIADNITRLASGRDLKNVVTFHD